MSDSDFKGPRFAARFRIFRRRLRIILSALSSRMEWINERVATKTGITRRRLLQVEFGVLAGFGFTMIQIGEYFAAVIFWVILGLLWISKALSWESGNRHFIVVLVKGGHVLLVLAVCAILITITYVRMGHEPWSNLAKLRESKIPPTEESSVALKDIPIYLECQATAYPLKEEGQPTIHVLPLSPDLLKGASTFKSFGQFQDVIVRDAWPSSGDGAWMSKDEQFKAMATPLMYKCDLQNLSDATVEDVTIDLFVRPSVSGNKIPQHVIPIYFDPMQSGAKFPFYVVNYCPTAIYADWPGNLQVHVLGESAPRRVALKLIKRSWPSEIMLFQSSPFRWGGRNACDWKWFY